MTRRTLSSIVACVLLVLLFGAAALMPVPYVTMSPGPTVNALGKTDGKPTIEVTGHRTYSASGDLRLTTVSVTGPSHELSLAEALVAWFDKTRAVYPRDVIYAPEKSVQDVQTESSVEMVSSQDTAIAAALEELGYDVPVQTEVLAVTKGSPAEGKLKTRDKLVRVNGVPITDAASVSRAVQKSGIGGRADFVLRRAGAVKTVSVTTRASDKGPKRAVVGVVVGEGYDFPFDVKVNLDEEIGGPSAGLIFSLAVYDRLTPGSLTGGKDIAGTGTIDASGRVGPIGGIQQKIVAAADQGASLFLVPPGNCGSALAADVGKDEIELVKAETMHAAVRAIRAYVDDPNASLPRCGAS